MKKFKFFALAFAAIAFAACSDDVIEGQGGGNGTTGDTTPAYLTISFSANSGNSSRSTADDANNNGDIHEDAEDSGHKNDGTETERKVDDVLVVIVPTNENENNVNYARLYNVGVSTNTAQNQDEKGTFTINNASNQGYVNSEPIELIPGKYNVLVVANPVSKLIKTLDEGDLKAGISNSNAVENLYKTITTGAYLPEESVYKMIAGGNAYDGTEKEFRVMMANKELNSDLTDKTYTVELKNTNDEDNPATAHIEVERAFSKITFRPNNNNIYEVPVSIGKVKAETVDAAVYNEESSSYEYKLLNAALDAAGNRVYVLLEENTAGTKVMKAVYKVDYTQGKQNVQKPTTGGSSETVSADVYVVLTATTDSDEGLADNKYVVKDIDNPEASLTYQSENVGDETNWYVKLEGYALVNLSKNVHYVRHTTNANGMGVPFGTLTGTNYLYTPYWAEKNDDANFVTNGDDIIFKNDGEGKPVSETWFYNTLAQVSGESKNLTFGTGGALMNGNVAATYYKSMPIVDDGNQSVTGGNHAGIDPESNPDLGKFMAYCFENSTDLEHQMHGLSTGISFVARIYSKPSCGNEELLGRFYRFNNHLFNSLAEIQESYGSYLMSDKFNELVKKESTETITKADLEELAKFVPAQGATNKIPGETIDLYDGGICYYYTTEIKHYDNGDNAALGNMEFAIMRNNIYSLAVTDINRIGDPFVDPTPNIPDEYPKAKAALNVEAKLLPWIVRYNDIEF